jgi:hypothetical protein
MFGSPGPYVCYFLQRDRRPIYAWPPPEETPVRQFVLATLAHQAAFRDGQVQ